MPNTYDVNGNIKSDGSKGISNIVYNHLNLPTLFNFGSGKNIEITYAANGLKLKKVVKNTGGSIQYTQHYINGIEYKDNGIEAINYDEGRFYNSSGTYRREYYIRDHLGNIRITFSDLNNNRVIATSGEILQETHYDPFGLRLEGSYINNSAPDNMYQYNGKENNTDHGLNFIDYGARWYNPTIGRFSSIDPSCKERAWVNPFNFVQNNPISRVDPSGMLDSTYHINYVTGETQTLNAVGGTSFHTYIIDNGLPAADKDYIGTAIHVDNSFNQLPNFEMATGALSGADNPFEMFLGLPLSGAKALGAGIGIVSLLKSNVDDASSTSLKYATGTYNELRRLAKGSGLDAHHVGQQALMKKLISSYNPGTAPAILVPRHGHTIGKVVSTNMKNISTARQLLARDIIELRRVYPDIPNNVLQTLIDLNKTVYPGAFIKS